MLLLILTAIFLTAERQMHIYFTFIYSFFQWSFLPMSTKIFICVIFPLFHFFVCVYICVFSVCLGMCVCRCSCPCLCMCAEIKLSLRSIRSAGPPLLWRQTLSDLSNTQVGSNGWLLSPRDHLGSTSLVLGLQAIPLSPGFCTSIWRLTLMHSHLCRGTSRLQSWLPSPCFTFLKFPLQHLEGLQVYRT